MCTRVKDETCALPRGNNRNENESPERTRSTHGKFQNFVVTTSHCPRRHVAVCPCSRNFRQLVAFVQYPYEIGIGQSHAAFLPTHSHSTHTLNLRSHTVGKGANFSNHGCIIVVHSSSFPTLIYLTLSFVPLLTATHSRTRQKRFYQIDEEFFF